MIRHEAVNAVERLDQWPNGGYATGLSPSIRRRHAAFDMNPSVGGMLPAPRTRRADIQEQSIRNTEISLDAYYPKGYKAEFLQNWPTDKPLRIPQESLPAVTGRP